MHQAVDTALLSSVTWHNAQCLNSLIAWACWKLLFPEDSLEIGRDQTFPYCWDINVIFLQNVCVVCENPYWQFDAEISLRNIPLYKPFLYNYHVYK